MRQARDYRLSEQDFTVIEQALRQDKRPGVRQRCRVIRLLHLGYKPTQIAHLQALHLATVYDYYHRWRQGGLAELVTKARSGRPCKSNPAYCQALEELLHQEPHDLGYDFAIWTIDRLRAHLEKHTGIALSESRLRVLLKSLGYRYRRPKHDLGHLQDQPAKAQAAELLQELKKNAPKQRSSSSLWTKRP